MIDSMPDFDLTTPSGKQAFQQWLVNVIRNEVNSYARQVLAVSKTAGTIRNTKI
jgi:hypothetical protein